MDECGVTGQLRRQGHTLPIIAFTAQAMSNDRERWIRAGGDDHATKPTERTELIETIQQHMAPVEDARLAAK